MTFFCIADPESSPGFRLVGIQTHSVKTRSEALEALQEAVSNPAVGIILITEQAVSFMRKEVEELLYRQEFPLVLEIPSRGKRKRRKPVEEFLKQALGITV